MHTAQIIGTDILSTGKFWKRRQLILKFLFANFKGQKQFEPVNVYKTALLIGAIYIITTNVKSIVFVFTSSHRWCLQMYNLTLNFIENLKKNLD